MRGKEGRRGKAEGGRGGFPTHKISILPIIMVLDMIPHFFKCIKPLQAEHALKTASAPMQTKSTTKINIELLNAIRVSRLKDMKCNFK